MKRTIYALGIFSFFCIQTAISQDTIVLQPGPEGKDAIINTYLPGESRPDYQLFRSMAWTHSGTPAAHRSLIDWDLSFLSPETTILDARLDLYFATWAPNYESHTGENASYLLRITEPWVENEVTWNNQPETTWDDVITLPQNTSPYQDYPDIDVTAQIQQMVSDPENNHGFLLRLVTEEYYSCMLFASSDYPDNPEKRPRLRIIYMGCIVPTADFDYELTGQSVSFTGISPTATEWHWDFGDGDTSNVQNPTHVYEEAGIYQVCLTVEDTCYFAEYCEEIEICTGPPVAGFTYEEDNLDVFFQNTTDLAHAYYWDFGDGYFSDLRDPWHNYQESGVYQVCLTSWNNCGTDSVCQWIELCARPASDFSFTIEDLMAFFEDQSERAESWYWDFGDGYYSDLQNPVHIYDTPENYKVCLTTWNECGADTACEMLYISAVSVPENEEGTFTIYPNPAKDKVFLKTFLTGKIDIILTDLGGKVVYQEVKDVNYGELIRIGLDGLEPGIYIIRAGGGEDYTYGKLAVMN